MIAGLCGGEVFVAEVEGTIIVTVVWFGPGRMIYDSDEQLEKAWPICAEIIPPKILLWWEADFLPKYAEFSEEAFGTGVKLRSWHLQLLAVDPKYLRKLLWKGETLKLRASADYNVAIYEKLGFIVGGETRYTGVSGSFPMWGMFQRIDQV
ncbi:hypothetical protein GALMADRAFT_215038 [Galerina marginata CBS 339.88]|uniref:N-acetyltransferase domain-containing protein n=1 Tax=Galerina marginata (strain CBS 339.88) TaxID=685588 RepID=A0A067SPP8_GALM3|nr:hypothetical protein GALMADRAFT_215038 [Galerina marginata CBS 339.88]